MLRNIKLSYLNIFTIVRDVVFNAWVILLAFITGFLGVRAYYSYIYTPLYTSSVTISINVRSSSAYVASTLTDTTEMAAILQQVFISSKLREAVSETLGEEMTGTVTASQTSGTNLISISVADISPLKAYRTVNAVLNDYDILTGYTFTNVVVNVLSNPSVPTVPSNAVSPGSLALKAGLGLAVLTALAFAVLSFMRETIKNESDVEDMLNVPLFGTIYHEDKNKSLIARLRRKNKVIKFSDPLVNYSFTEALRRISVKLDYLRKSKKYKVIMITSVDEHEGKTTASVNIAMSLANMGNKVLLIDADLRKPTVEKYFPYFMKNRETEFADVLKHRSTPEETIYFDDDSKLYLLAGNRRFRDSSEVLSGSTFVNMVQLLRDKFDFIIIDTPPVALVADAETIAATVDATLLVVHQDVSPVSKINDSIDSLNKSQANVIGCIFNNVRTLVGTVSTKYESKSKRGGYYYY